MGALTLIGAAGLGIFGGWSAANPLRLGSRLLATLATALAVPATALALASPVAAAVSLGGVLAGAALRLLLDFVLMQRATPQGRH